MTLVPDRPAAGPPRPWRFPAFQRREVAGGRVLTCRLPGRPLAVMSLVSTSGAVTEPAGKEGVAQLLASALSEGTSKHDAYAFAVATERLGASWRANADWDSFRCGFEVPVDNIVAAASLLAEAVREPAFDESSMVRIRDERVDELRLEMSQPAPRASAAFAAALFEPATRYSKPDGGALGTVSDLTPDDIRAYHSQRLGPDAATLIVVGDVTDADVDAAAEAVFGGWSGGSTSDSSPVISLSGGAPRLVLVDRPGAVQSMLYVGHDAPPRTSPDYVPMTTMALVLGGMFNSRLNYKLREEKGYTYGAFASFDCRKHGGVFSSRSAVQTAVTGPALADLVAELRTMSESGTKADELELARSYRAGVFPINFAGPGAVAAGLGDLVVHGLADDYFDRLRQQVLDVTLDEVNQAATARVKPQDLVGIVVGDAEQVADSLVEAGLGKPEIVADED